jgi:hypothetical protein
MHSYNILNHSKWRRIEKALSECLVIDVFILMTSLQPYAKNVLCPKNLRP